MTKRDSSNPDGWIPFSERQDVSKRNYANHVRVQTFENVTTTAAIAEDESMQPCPTCGVMMHLMQPENVWICSSCGYNLDKIKTNNNPNYPPNFSYSHARQKQQQEQQHQQQNTKPKKKSRIITKSGQGTGDSSSSSSQRKGVIVSKDIHAVGRHGKPFRSNRDPYETPGSHPLDKDLVQAGYQLKSVKDVSDTQWYHTIRTKPLPSGPPRNLAE